MLKLGEADAYTEFYVARDANCGAMNDDDCNDSLLCGGDDYVSMSECCIPNVLEPVDCDGYYENVDCNVACGTGNYNISWNTTVAPQNGGAACPAAYVEGGGTSCSTGIACITGFGACNPRFTDPTGWGCGSMGLPDWSWVFYGDMQADGSCPAGQTKKELVVSAWDNSYSGGIAYYCESFDVNGSNIVEVKACVTDIAGGTCGINDSDPYWTWKNKNDGSGRAIGSAFVLLIDPVDGDALAAVSLE